MQLKDKSVAANEFEELLHSNKGLLRKTKMATLKTFTLFPRSNGQNHSVKSSQYIYVCSSEHPQSRRQE